MSGTEGSGAYQRPANLTYALDERPPAGKLLLLGLQYAVLDAFYLVLVAIIVRHSHATSEERIALMGISCVALAIGTVLQALPRGPVGSGFMAPPVFSATYMGPSVAAAEIGGMRLVFGMTIVAGLAEALLAFCLHRLRIIITPVVSGLTVFIVGLQLGIIGIGEVLDVEHEMLPAFPIHLMVTISILVLCMALSIWGRGVWKLICSIIGLGFGMAAASLAGLIDPQRLAAVANSAWIEVPHPSLLDHSFDLGLLPAFLAAGAAAAFRVVGVVTTAQRINNAAWRHPDMTNIRKGVLADGLTNVAGGMLGTAGMSISPSMVAVSGTTGATSRVIAFAATAYLLVLGFSPRLAGSFWLHDGLLRVLPHRQRHATDPVAASRSAGHLCDWDIDAACAERESLPHLFSASSRGGAQPHVECPGNRPYRRCCAHPGVPARDAATQYDCLGRQRYRSGGCDGLPAKDRRGLASFARDHRAIGARHALCGRVSSAEPTSCREHHRHV
jgi:xanthine/uracil permease